MDTIIGKVRSVLDRSSGPVEGLERKSTDSIVKGKNDEILRELVDQEEKIVKGVQDYTATNWKEVNRPVPSTGVYDGADKGGLTEQAKEQTRLTEIKNVTHATHCAQDMEILGIRRENC